MSRILIIDDDQAMLNVLRRGLSRAGHETIEATSGRDALRLFGEQSVDIVVTDIIMPDLEGVELIQALRRSHPKLPIIAISGGGRLKPGTYLNLAQASGAAKALQKPFELDQLLSAVNELLGRPPNSRPPADSDPAE